MFKVGDLVRVRRPGGASNTGKVKHVSPDGWCCVAIDGREPGSYLAELSFPPAELEPIDGVAGIEPPGDVCTVHITLAVKVDRAAWATEYCIEEAEVEDDVRAYVQGQVAESAAAGAKLITEVVERR